MGIIKNKLKEQINDNNRQTYTNSTGIILSYDRKDNKASITYTNPNTGSVLKRDKVPVSTSLGGLTIANIRPGQTCTLSFIKNNIFVPIITGITTGHYKTKTCSDQGAYIVDDEIILVEKPTQITPMINNWIEESNTNKDKYSNDEIGNYTSVDASNIINEYVNDLNRYSSKEEGITNLDTNSTIKFRDNGDIDIFVSGNTGIRICNKTKKIKLYGNIEINGIEFNPNND